MVHYPRGKTFGHQEFSVFRDLFCDWPYREKRLLKSKEDPTFRAGLVYLGTVTYVPEVVVDDYTTRPGHYEVTSVTGRLG